MSSHQEGNDSQVSASTPANFAKNVDVEAADVLNVNDDKQAEEQIRERKKEVPDDQAKISKCTSSAKEGETKARNKKLLSTSPQVDR